MLNQGWLNSPKLTINAIQNPHAQKKPINQVWRYKHRLVAEPFGVNEH